MGFDRKCFSGFCSTAQPCCQVQVADFSLVSDCRNFIKNILGEWMYTASVMKSAIGRVIPSPACLVGIQTGVDRSVSFIVFAGFVVELNQYPLRSSILG